MPTPITMPALSPTMTEGVLARWLVEEGAAVAPGDVIAEIETDKATMEVEAVDEGVLAKILVPAGTEGVAVNAPIAILAQEGEDVSGYDAPPAAPQAPAEPPAPQQAAAPTAQPQQGPGERDDKRVFASPLARRIAADRGLDLAAIQGSGPHGRIVKADVETARPLPPLTGGGQGGVPPQQAVQGAAPTALPITMMRRVIAQRLAESKSTIPHFYLEADVTLDALLAARADINAGADGAYKVSVNDMLVKAAACALMAVPAAHVAWGAEAMTQFHSADIAVAVATDGGLITPIVRAAHAKGLAAIATEVKDLAARARAGALKPAEFQGGSFTISNLGMYGVRAFSAIINPPQSMILAVGAGEQRPVVEGGVLAIRTVMTATLSADHRAVDGAVAAQWLAAFRGFVETPARMLA